jgi:glucan phosphoethanolaminetransferase (alkaline phosphatase superfamily)
MQRVWNTIAHLVCGLWLGGLIALFIFVVRLFHVNHDLGVQAAPQLFEVFEIYQFYVAAVAILAAIILGRKSVLILFLLATVFACVVHFALTPKILEMARLGQTHTDEFGEIHGISMLVYMTDTILVFVAGILLTVRPKPRH